MSLHDKRKPSLKDKHIALAKKEVELLKAKKKTKNEKTKKTSKRGKKGK